MEFKNLDQNKAFMRNEASKLNISTGAAYSTYYSRNLLEKLAGINFGNLVVKGSFSQYVHLKSLSRPVLDIDLSSTLEHNIPIKLLYKAIYENSDDIITYDVTRLPTKTPNGVYKIPVSATIKYPGDERFVKVPINVDFKEKNSVIFETQYKKVAALFTGDKPFYINTPSFEEHIAEKLYIITHNRKTDVLNTRVKDFYDIYKLHGNDYDLDKFALYFQAMLIMYGENLENLSTKFLNKTFIKEHSELWDRMSKKYEFVDNELSLDEAVYYTKAVLAEQIQKIETGSTEQAMKLVRNKKANY